MVVPGRGKVPTSSAVMAPTPAIPLAVSTRRGCMSACVRGSAAAVRPPAGHPIEEYSRRRRLLEVEGPASAAVLPTTTAATRKRAISGDALKISRGALNIVARKLMWRGSSLLATTTT